MAAEIVQCAHCLTRVVPMSNGICPACRKDTREKPESAADRRPVTHEKAWDKYQQSLQAITDERMASVRRIDEEFLDLRARAIAHLQANQGSDHAAADRIDGEILPRFAEAVDQLRQEDEPKGSRIDDTSVTADYANTRKQSWQSLAEALRACDMEKLRRHNVLWSKSEFLVIGAQAEIQSQARPDPAALVKNFQRALVTFTPHLLATPAIVILNVLVFLAMVATGVNVFAPTVLSVLEWGANYGPKTTNGQWWRLVSSMFLHYGILHLAFNMWVLWSLGRLVERLVGNVGFVVSYFASGVAGSIASLAWNPVVVSAGASGAVFGVAGALLGLLTFRRDTIPTTVLMPLRNSMVAFLLYNVVFGMTASGIDMAAHIGGLVAGFACGIVLSQPLSIEMMARRKYRNLAVLAAGTVVLFLAAVALPNAPPDIDSELQHFVEMEKEVLNTYNALVRRTQRGTISDVEFVETIERDVLPDWIETRQNIEGLINVPGVDRAYLMRLTEYMQAREESWKLRIEAQREQDMDKLERANELWQKAEEIVSER